jgi:hypothetical protein
VSAADRFHGAKGGPFKKGDPRINPGGKPSVVRDLERARAIGTPVEVAAVLTEWLDAGPARLNELGPEGFLTGLRAALDEATKRILPVTPEEARAMWWRAILPVAFAGPMGPKDSNWTYAQQEVGVRLLGKPKETIALEDGGQTPIDWTRVPEDERPPLLAAVLKLQGYLKHPESDTEH